MGYEQQVEKKYQETENRRDKKKKKVTGAAWCHSLSGILHIHTNTYILTVIKSFDTSTVQKFLQPLIVKILSLSYKAVH